MKTILDRIQLVMMHLSWNRSDLARAMQTSTANITQMFKRESVPGTETLMALCKNAPEISISWLISGEGSMIKARDHPSVDIPVVGDIAAGNPIEITDIEPLSYISINRKLIGSPSDYLAFRVYGDSMAPRIIHNDIVLLCTVFDPWEMDGYVCAVKIDTEITLKKIWINHAARQTVLLPFNCAYSPIVLDESSPDCRIIGYALSITRAL